MIPNWFVDVVVEVVGLEERPVGDRRQLGRIGEALTERLKC